MFKKTIATFAMIATIATAATFALPTAEAEAKNGRNAAFAFGAFTGLAVGALAHGHHRPHYRPHRPRPAHYGRPAPWSPGWYSYCSSRYRSFNPHTGYFRGYDGRLHFCH